MLYRFEFHCYSRQFKQPLKTSHGIWERREGIILCLTNEQGNKGWGEIAPLSWFGSETLSQAFAFCQQLPQIMTAETIENIPDKLPACQFGFESALEAVNSAEKNDEIRENKLKFCQLLPTGDLALNTWKSLWQQDHQTFKWKIGVDSISEEIKTFKALTSAMVETVTTQSIFLRLDANAGLNWEQANQWLQACDRITEKYTNIVRIEFLEQPLPITQFPQLLKLCDRYSTPIALDESVANLSQLQNCYQQGWRSIFVIKPSIFGSPKKLREFCAENQIEAVFSSVFETEIGRKAALKLATELSTSNYALGFGINHWFSENESQFLIQ